MSCLTAMTLVMLASAASAGVVPIATVGSSYAAHAIDHSLALPAAPVAVPAPLVAAPPAPVFPAPAPLVAAPPAPVFPAPAPLVAAPPAPFVAPAAPYFAPSPVLV